MAGMPRLRDRHAAKPTQSARRALVASAALIRQSTIRAIPEQREWQVQAWDFYDKVGELRFAAQWIANALSRCTLHVGIGGDGRSEPLGIDDHEGGDARASVPLDELFGGSIGHPEMLSRIATHITVAGESFLVGWDDPASGERRWQVCSSDEINRSGSNKIKIRLPENDKQVEIVLDDGSSTVIRLWRPHPRRAWEADSPVRAALPVLKELVDLSAHICASVESRLAGAGVLLLPEEAIIPGPLNDQEGQALHEDPAMATLIDAMVTPISNRDSAAAVVPILIRIPNSATAKPEYLTFSTPLDERIQGLREASIRRFATVVDIPAEVLTGVASANRWNAWKISEDAIKLHLEPLLQLIVNTLTVMYLRPALAATGVRNANQYVIYYDASDLILRPNRGPESQNLYGQTLIKGAVVRSANGFTETDAPDEAEQKQILLTQLATKGINPYLAAPYLKALGIEIELPPVPVPIGQRQIDNVETGYGPGGTREQGRPAAPTRLPTRNEPLPSNPDVIARTGDAPGMSIGGHRAELDFTVVEMAALRALELAGKRLLNKTNRQWRGQVRGVEPWAIHTHIPVADLDDALDGAYNLLLHCLPAATELHGVLDTYVRDCLSEQRPHDPDRLGSMLAATGCLVSGGGARAIA